MERGEGSKRGRINPRSSSVAKAGQQQYEAPANNNSNRSNMDSIHPRDQDHYMPLANITRIMRRVLPPHAKIADDAKETVQECVSEYINLITSEANERCHREQRKTINAEDLLWAMGMLGFQNYVEPLTLFLNRYRDAQSERNSVRGEPFVRRTVDFGQFIPQPENGLPPVAVMPLPDFPMVQPEGIYDPMNGMNFGYYADNAGAAGSSFGPYAQFK